MEINDVDYLIPLDPFTKKMFTFFLIDSVILICGFPTPLTDIDKEIVREFVFYVAEDMDKTITVLQIPGFLGFLK